MPSPIHTTIVDLLEAHPEVLSYLLGLQGPAPVGPLVPANGTTSATFTIERRVDSAFLLGSSDNPGGFVLVEVQLGRDRDKVFAWALYVELARSRYRCEGALVVLTIQGRVRRWIERDIARRTGQLGSWRQLQPLVIALDEIAPAMLLRAEMPYLAPLAVAAHARSPDVAEIAGRAVDLTAMKSLPTPLAIEQLDAILAMVDAGLRAALEKRAMKHPEFRSKFFRDLAAKFTAEGVAKGVARRRGKGRGHPRDLRGARVAGEREHPCAGPRLHGHRDSPALAGSRARRLLGGRRRAGEPAVQGGAAPADTKEVRRSFHSAIDEERRRQARRVREAAGLKLGLQQERGAGDHDGRKALQRPFTFGHPSPLRAREGRLVLVMR